MHETSFHVEIWYYHRIMADILELPIYIMFHHIASEPYKLLYFLLKYRSPMRHTSFADGLHSDSTTRGWDVM